MSLRFLSSSSLRSSEGGASDFGVLQAIGCCVVWIGNDGGTNSHLILFKLILRSIFGFKATSFWKTTVTSGIQDLSAFNQSQLPIALLKVCTTLQCVPLLSIQSTNLYFCHIQVYLAAHKRLTYLIFSQFQHQLNAKDQYNYLYHTIPTDFRTSSWNDKAVCSSKIYCWSKSVLCPVYANFSICPCNLLPLICSSN